jgi:hypothetical protein
MALAIGDDRLGRALDVLEDVIRMADDHGAVYLPVHVALEGEIEARRADRAAASERLSRIRAKRLS